MEVWLWIKTPHIFLGLVLTYFSSEQLRCSLPHILSNNNPCLICFRSAHQWDDPATASFMSMLSVQREEYREQLWKLEVNPISYFLFCFVVDALAPLSLLLYICAIKYIYILLQSVSVQLSLWLCVFSHSGGNYEVWALGCPGGLAVQHTHNVPALSMWLSTV